MSTSTTEPFEKAALRVLKAARAIFEAADDADNGVPQTSEGVMRAALVCAHKDFELISLAQQTTEEPVDDYVLLRARQRCALALDLAEFYDMFGPNHDEEPAVTS